MELKNDEFQTLRLRVDKISSELDKKNTVQAVNTKWMITVGAVILASLGFTSFVQLPREASRAATEQVGIQIQDKAEKIISDLENHQTTAKIIEAELTKVSELDKIANLPIGTIMPSMLEWSSFAETVGDPYDFDEKVSRWVLADGRQDITKTRYGKLLGNTRHTPDLRGMFLRGMNDGRNDGKQDPEQGRTAGEYQRDALQQHGHVTDAKKLKYHDPTTNLGYKSEGGAHAPAASVTNVTGANAEVETRPKNVAVYFYIKIN